MPDSKSLPAQSNDAQARTYLVWALGLAGFFLLYALSWLAFQEAPTTLILFPILLTGWLGGWRLGLIAAVVALPLNVLLPLLWGADPTFSGGDAWFYAGAAVAGVCAGQWHTTRRALSQQHAERLQVTAHWRQKHVEQERALMEVQVVRDALQAELQSTQEQVASQAKLIAKQKDVALQANQLKTELLASVGHELRSPLGAIIGFTEMLHAGYYGTISRRQQHILQRIIRKAHDMTTLVNDLLDQAQLETGNLSLNTTLVAPATLLAQVDDLLGLKAEKKAVRLHTNIEPDVPPVLIGDPMRLQQILTNLVDNAIKFTDHGGEVTVIMNRPDPDNWSITVRDDGCGISPADQAGIFEAFRRGEHSLQPDDSPGFGLGLAIVKQLTEMMGGSIRVHSEPDQGSTFTVRLPLVAAPAQLV